MKRKYYSLDRLLEIPAQYYMAFGERSDGKTTSALTLAVEDYVKNGNQSVLLRRQDEDFLRGRGAVMFDGLVARDEISRITGGKWTGVTFIRREWYLCKQDENIGLVHDETWFCRGMALTSMAHDKSTSYPRVMNVIFDEFIAKGSYLPDEFSLFINVLSTIIRDRTGVRVIMLGNTINRYCPYFKEMGLKHVLTMAPGSIDVYEYGESGLRVAVERTATSRASGKPSDVYFAFDSPTAKMITRGEWDLEIYPHKPMDFDPADIIFIYFIRFENEIFQCEVVEKEGCAFTFVHRKTTPIRDETSDLIYQLDVSPRPNVRTGFTSPRTVFDKKLYSFFAAGKVFYQDNDVGDTIRNFLAVDRQK